VVPAIGVVFVLSGLTVETRDSDALN
jgi:hypothetical protein